MTGGQLMVVLIVAIVMLASIIKGRMGISHRHRHKNRDGSHESVSETRIGAADNARLVEEVTRLKERIVVLERIATDKNHQLEEEFERLRKS